MITPNSEQVLNFLKAHFGKEYTKNEIAATLGISVPAVTGSINGLVKKGYVVERIETIEVEPATETRKAKMKDVRYETLTEAGLAYDPVAEEEERQAAKKAERERKAAEKAKAKAAADEVDA